MNMDCIRVDGTGNKEAIPIDSEEAVFDILGMKYIKPTDRESYSAQHRH